ncbi:META and DUF4377 domain-containing protein [Vulcaniibacterium tengchongense]|uniref:Heat shock protein HslJ n=1 Tax=Vulcaniibacterium tengchongense TaxID=1273429 RepID=A0A3N4VJY1_9GAMM|nr:META and DUF4377 domain-containing protein [Vulcaniibacterium tengchongense]RPE80049.1 heat shock protein HslJ [Vulcaniibacterium tengchongense]
MKRLPLLVLPLVLGACARPVTGDAPSAPPAAVESAAPRPALEAYRWQLRDARDARGRRLEALFADPARPLRLDFGAGRIAVANACNRIGGAYRLDRDRLRIERLQSTLMACADPKLGALDREIAGRLEAAPRFALAGGEPPTLTLTTPAGETLRFQGEATPETRYGGPGDTVFLEVAAQRQPCPHPLIRDMQCLRVRELQHDAQGLRRGAGEWAPLYQEIEGYAHQPGVRNVLRVKRYRVPDPPADAPDVAYVLDLVVESEIER